LCHCLVIQFLKCCDYQVTAKVENVLSRIFHTPFYTGWVVSDRFGIRLGEVRGDWDPIVTTEEFKRGIDILREHDTEKSRVRSCFYLLRGLLWIQKDGKNHKMFGSTPRGRSHSYAYYITHAKPDGKKIHIPCERVDTQIPAWVQSIQIDSKDLPAIREVYSTQLMKVTQNNRENRLREMKRQLTGLREEEARLGRLYITNKISEEIYEQLRKEWQIKFRNIELNIADIEREERIQLDDLEVALALMTKISHLYFRLEEKDRAQLLQIIAKRIIVNSEGDIIDHELRSPFAYLHGIVVNFPQIGLDLHGSEQLRIGAPVKTRQSLQKTTKL